MKSQILFPLESTFNFIESSRGCFFLEHSIGGSKPPEKGGRAVIRTLTKVRGGGGLASHPGALSWIRHCTVVVHYIQMYLSYILNKSWLCILSPRSGSFFLLRKGQNAHYYLWPLIHILIWQGSPIPNGTNDRLFLLGGRDILHRWPER